MPCPGGPKIHIADENPIAAICVESQWRDFELLKCCAALSEWMKSRRSILARQRGTPPTVCCFRCATDAATKWRIL